VVQKFTLKATANYQFTTEMSKKIFNDVLKPLMGSRLLQFLAMSRYKK